MTLSSGAGRVLVRTVKGETPGQGFSPCVKGVNGGVNEGAPHFGMLLTSQMILLVLPHQSKSLVLITVVVTIKPIRSRE